MVQNPQRLESSLADRPSGEKNEGESNVVYQLSKSKESQMQNNEDVKKIDKELLEQDWLKKVKIANACVEFKDKKIEMLSDSQSMWNGHLGEINVAELWIELSPSD